MPPIVALVMKRLAFLLHRRAGLFSFEKNIACTSKATAYTEARFAS
jgi:hypothetical protein